MDIKGKTAIITGGASGLGAATAKRLHDMGANILVADMNVITGTKFCQELGENVAFAEVNVTNTDQVQAAVDKCMETFNGVHILVNCAGTGMIMKTVGRDGPHDLGVFKQIVDINLIGTFDFVRLAAFKMQDNEPNEDGERGVIINCASVAAYDGQIGQVAYSASKAGVVGMTLTIARDMARSGIRCCTITPGIFNTPLMQMAGEEMIAQLEATIPFPKRLGKPDEFATLAQQIVENSFLNGEVIRLDGAIRMPPK
jgi:NAD(P)-dependent dehydrogenase (short-subunit alcohol dehydrogenase family)